MISVPMRVTDTELVAPEAHSKQKVSKWKMRNHESTLPLDEADTVLRQQRMKV